MTSSLIPNYRCKAAVGAVYDRPQCHKRRIAGGHRPPLQLGILITLFLAACSCSPSTSSAPSADTLEAAAKPDAPVQKLDLTYEKPVVGAKVRAVASDLPAGKTVDLKWSTVTGGWVIEDYYYFRGKKYSETM